MFVILAVAIIWVFGYDLLIDWWGLIYTILIILIIKSKYFQKSMINRYLQLLGNYSMGMWFISGIFFLPNGKLQRVAYFLNNPVLILLWILLITFIVSYCIDMGTKRVMWQLHQRKKELH